MKLKTHAILWFVRYEDCQGACYLKSLNFYSKNCLFYVFFTKHCIIDITEGMRFWLHWNIVPYCILSTFADNIMLFIQYFVRVMISHCWHLDILRTTLCFMSFFTMVIKLFGSKPWLVRWVIGLYSVLRYSRFLSFGLYSK